MFKNSFLIAALALFITGLAQAQTTIDTLSVLTSDDAEELSSAELNSSLNPGDLDIGSSDLEMVDDSSWNGIGQTIGIRFEELDLPVGTVIQEAYIEFQADGSQSAPASLAIVIEDVDDAEAFENTPFNISSRTGSIDTVLWNVTPWTSGELYQTPDLSTLIQSVIDRGGWEALNDIAFIITGEGQRRAESSDGLQAPRLHLVAERPIIIQVPELVAEIPDEELLVNWEFAVDVKPYFIDRDSELSFAAFETGTNVLPSWMTFVDGVLSGANDVVGTTSITIEASSEGEAITDTFEIVYIPASGDFTLAIFHNNDGESDLLADSVVINGETVAAGSISQFKFTLDSLRDQASDRGYESIMLSSGDNFLAGLEYNASQANGVFYDALALDALDYDAIDLGNHDFDFGTQVLADLINSFTTNLAPYLTSNLSFENVPELQALVDADRILPFTVVNKGGQDIGVIGLTTPILDIISSPGQTTISDAIADSVQKYVNILEGQGINKIILISHLQGIDEDLDFVDDVTGIDVIIAGGGDELLANNPFLGDPYGLPTFDSYPIVAQDADGEDVYIVTTPGGYRYLGNLLIDFDASGNVTRVYNSDPVFITGQSDPSCIASIEQPIIDYIGNLSTNVVATVEDSLDFRRETLRVGETNGGNLFADAVLWQAQQNAASFGVKVPEIAMQNAGGLRIESYVGEGDFTEDLTYEIAAFTNIVSVVEDLTPEKLLELMEHGVASAPAANGRFPQIAGFTMVYDPSQEAGNRIQSIILDDSTVIVENGEVAPDAPTVSMATIDFIANGGDGYPFAPFGFTTLGNTYQQALLNYLTDPSALNGVVTEAQYPLGMNERTLVEIAPSDVLSAIQVSEDFNGCETIGFPTDWTAFSVSSNADWTCSDDTRGASGEAGDYSVEMNGFGADMASDDWLITPKLTFEADQEYIFNFNSMSRFSGPHIEILYSSDYSGAGDPNAATWTRDLDAEAVAAQNDSWDFVNSGDLILSGLDGEYFYAFRYTSTGTGGGDGTYYRVDDVVFRNKCLIAEDFNDNCDLGDWTTFETLTQGLITCSSTGFNDDVNDFSLQFNGFGVGDGEAWLVSPKMALGEASYALSFASIGQFSGPAVEVLYSTDYAGVGNPNDATWTNIPDAEAAITGSFAKSGDIDIAFIAADAYIAFKYTSLGTSGGQSLRFRLDEIKIQEPAAIVDLGEKRIYEIQGSAAETPFPNGIVQTGGIVTAVFDENEPYTGAGFNANLGGFFLQDAEGDSDASTSDGIFVFTDATVQVGDSVTLTAQVTEFFEMTELIEVSDLQVVSNGNALPAAVQVELPVSDFEPLEGMLVEFIQELTVTENYNLGIHGELMLSSGGVLYQPTQLVDANDADPNGNTADGTSNVAAVTALGDANDANQIILDDARSGNFQTPVPYLDPLTNTVRVGSEVNNVTGVLAYSFGAYRVQPTAAPVFTYDARPEVPEFEEATLKVAAFNVLNYFNGDGQGGGFPTSRGAETEEELALQTQKIVAALVELDADVVGLIEIENDAENGFSAMQSLVDSLNAALGAAVYDYVKTGIVERADASADEIKNGFIFKTTTVALEGDYAILNDSYDVNYFDSKNRPAVAQSFKEVATGEVFTAVVNHFKSKGSGCDDVNDPNLSDGQGNCNGTRTLAAGTLASWLETDPTNSGDEDYIILGDLNAYAQEDPIDTLRARGYINLTSDSTISYVFEGEVGTLDYGMADSSIMEQIVGAAVWNINSVEPNALIYYQAGDLFEANPFRSSDHDPVVIGLKLQSDPCVDSDLTVDAGEDQTVKAGYVYEECVELNASSEGGEGTVAFEWNTGETGNAIYVCPSESMYFFVTATDALGCVASDSVHVCAQDVSCSYGGVEICWTYTYRGYVLAQRTYCVSSFVAYLLNNYYNTSRSSWSIGACDDATCEIANAKVANGEFGSEEYLTNEEYSLIYGASSMEVYPNPAEGQFTLALNNLNLESGEVTVQIADAVGYVVLEESYLISTNAVELPIEFGNQLAAGVYTVIVNTGAKKISKQLIVR